MKCKELIERDGLANASSAIKTIGNKMTTADTVQIKGGYVTADEFIEPDGMTIYYAKNGGSDPWFDNGISVSPYNNWQSTSGKGRVTLSRVSASSQSSPFASKHSHILKVVTNGECTPDAGGIYIGHQSSANKRCIEKIVARIPKGYSLRSAYNAQGTGSRVTTLGDARGTGNWKEYAVYYECGSSGSFSTGGHLYLSVNGEVSGVTNKSVTWYVAYASNCDITDKTYLRDFAVLDSAKVRKGSLGCPEFIESGVNKVEI